MADFSNELEQETKKKAEKERKGLIIDFDEAVAEQKADPIKVKFQGEVFELPSAPPAWLPLFINRKAQDGVIDDQANLEVIERLLGKDFADRILDGSNFISFDLINDVILSPVFEEWGLEITDPSGNK